MFLPTDDELFAAVRLDDRKAFNLLYDRYWAIVYKKAFLYLHDAEACMGIVNDIFVNIWEKRDALQIISFKNYLTAAARYRVYNHIKAGSTSRLTYVEDYEQLADVGMARNHAEQNIWEVELKKDLDHVLETLPARCREIFVLSRMDQLSNTEIALKLSISQRTVENQLSYALRHLKPFLKQYATMMLVVAVTCQHLN